MTMPSFKDCLEAINYKISDGFEFQWTCYGNHVHAVGTDRTTIYFSTVDQTVFEVNVHDYDKERAYRLVHPDYQEARKLEAENRKVSDNQAWDDVRYTDLETADDLLSKIVGIENGLEYDTRIVIPLDLTDEEFRTIAMAAHESDMSINAYIDMVIRQVMEMEKDRMEEEASW
jgi:hypothetical protein